MKKRCDLIIIGGGAAGLACAVSAARSFDGSVLLLDRMPRVGKKILATGNGRCNLSSRNLSREFYRGSFDVNPILEEFPDIRGFFEGLGLYTFCDETGRIYPLSNTASSVNEALRFAAEEKGVRILTDSECTEISKSGGEFSVKAGEWEIKAKSAVLACGGCAAPVQGSNGSGFSLAKALGIKINPPYPALCALHTDDTKALDGIRSRCGASLFKDNQLVKREYGGVQFTKKGLSGICIFNLSAAFKNTDKNIEVCLDLLPDYTSNDAYNMLLSASKCRRRNSPDEIFSGIFNKKIALYLLKRINIPVTNISKKLDYSDIHKLTAAAKNLEFKVKGRADFESAQVTAGGVCGSEIDESLMSKKHAGLFFAGEIIDVWGDCGGYNLHFAFASGIKAGSSAAKFLASHPK